MYAPGIDLIVVNYQTPADLRDFCASYVRHFPTVPSTLHIVCNEVTDRDRKTVEEILPTLPRDVEVYLFEKNLFYSGAANKAAAVSHRETLCILNADTQFKEHTIDKCFNALMDNPSWGALGPLQIGDKGEITHAGIFGTLDSPKHRGWQMRPRDEYRDVVDSAVTISGAAYFTKRSVWDELDKCPTYRSLHPRAVGPFLPTPHYYEETWFSYHLQAHGYKCVYFGEAEMIHRWHKASPPGGWADQQMPVSRKMFRDACDHHNIVHD